MTTDKMRVITDLGEGLSEMVDAVSLEDYEELQEEVNSWWEAYNRAMQDGALLKTEVKRLKLENENYKAIMNNSEGGH